jgi:hypothetical protein
MKDLNRLHGDEVEKWPGVCELIATDPVPFLIVGGEAQVLFHSFVPTLRGSCELRQKNSGEII